MSKKDLIYQALKSVESNSYYGWTEHTKFPRCVFFLVSNTALKLSNKRHEQKVVYQVSYFSERPLNIENDEKLWGITEAIEANNLLSNEWREVIDVETTKGRAIYHYWMEVR